MLSFTTGELICRMSDTLTAKGPGSCPRGVRSAAFAVRIHAPPLHDASIQQWKSCES